MITPRSLLHRFGTRVPITCINDGLMHSQNGINDSAPRYARPGLGENYFNFAMNASMGIAARVIILTLPREASSAETRPIVSLSGASTTLTKS